VGKTKEVVDVLSSAEAVEKGPSPIISLLIFDAYIPHRKFPTPEGQITV
jgi:hypothetical protein